MTLTLLAFNRGLRCEDVANADHAEQPTSSAHQVKGRPEYGIDAKQLMPPVIEGDSDQSNERAKSRDDISQWRVKNAQNAYSGTIIDAGEALTIAQRLDENHRQGYQAHRAHRTIQQQMRRYPEVIASQQQVPSNIPRQPKLTLHKRAEKQPRACTAKGTLWEALYLRHPAPAGMRCLHGWRCAT